MNACGQHNMSAIGFRDVNQSWKISGPSTQVLWWWNLGNGSGRFSDKVIKFQVEEVQMLCVIF
jgi:hypothetical protein